MARLVFSPDMLRSSLLQGVMEVLSGLGREAALEPISKHAKECVLLFNEEDKVPVKGSSRIGGLPDLPPDVEWPAGFSADCPTARANLLVQLSLPTIPDFDGRALPLHGHLWLFLQALPLTGPPRVQAIYSDAPDDVLAPRDAPDGDSWVLGEELNPVPLRFEVASSIPWYRHSLLKQLRESCPSAGGYWMDVAAAFDRPEAVGQIGGVATSAQLEDMAKIMVLRHMNRLDLLPVLRWESIAELELDMARVPQYVESPDELAAWRASFDELRPGVGWLQAHREHLAEWQLLLRLDSNPLANFSLGDSHPLWLFGRNGDLAAHQFGRLLALDGS